MAIRANLILHITAFLTNTANLIKPIPDEMTANEIQTQIIDAINALGNGTDENSKPKIQLEIDAPATNKSLNQTRIMPADKQKTLDANTKIREFNARVAALKQAENAAIERKNHIEEVARFNLAAIAKTQQMAQKVQRIYRGHKVRHQLQDRVTAEVTRITESRDRLLNELNNKSADHASLIREYEAKTSPTYALNAEANTYATEAQKKVLTTKDQEIAAKITALQADAAIPAKKARTDILTVWAHATIAEKTAAIAVYEAAIKTPNPLLTLEVLEELKIQDEKIAAAIKQHKENDIPLHDKRSKKFKAAETALKALERQAQTLAERAKAPLIKGDTHSMAHYRQLKKGQQAVEKVCAAFRNLRDDYLNLHIDLAEFHKRALNVVQETKWDQIDSVAKIINEHRGHKFEWNFKRGVHHFLKSLFGESVAQFFAPTATQKTTAATTKAFQQVTEDEPKSRFGFGSKKDS